MEFSEKCIYFTDKILNEIRNNSTDHKMNSMLLESVLMTREILNCYYYGKLSATAHESLMSRMGQLNFYLKYFNESIEPRLSGKLFKNSSALGQGWQSRYFTYRILFK